MISSFPCIGGEDGIKHDSGTGEMLKAAQT